MNLTALLAQGLRNLAGTLAPVEDDGSLRLYGEHEVKIHRADGTIEQRVFKNTLIYQGINRLAFRATTYTNTVAQYLVVGTQTAAHSLASVQAGIGEVSRKIAASIVQSQDWIALTATWGGASDSLTGVVLSTGAISDYVNSHASNGIYFSMSNSVNTTLAASDTLQLTCRIRVGSHNLGQST